MLSARRAGVATTSWRRRACGSSSCTCPAAPHPECGLPASSAADGALLLRDTHVFIAPLEHFKRFLAKSAEARELVAEASTGSRRLGLHIIFEGLDVGFRDMEREEKDVAAGRAVFSPHQIDSARMTRVAHVTCARLALMQRAGRLVLRPADIGFFANFLAVLDAMLLAPSHLHVEVDWRLTGKEQHFTYTPPRSSDCVWKTLFKPLSRGMTARAPGAWQPPLSEASTEQLECDQRFNLLFTSRFRSFFARSQHCDELRRAYHSVYKKWVHPSHPNLVDALDGPGAELRRCLSIGVHKRVDTPGTAEYQTSRWVPTSSDFVHAVQLVMNRVEGRECRTVERIFLATDDANAEATFRAAFGAKLIVRGGVQRVPGGLNSDGTLNEVHIKSPFNPGCSVQDAVDVVADALLLSSCRHVLHMDSNVTSAVSLMNPETCMHHVVDILQR